MAGHNEINGLGDHEMRLRKLEEGVMVHITRCDARAKSTQWIMIIGFLALAMLSGGESPVGRAALRFLETFGGK